MENVISRHSTSGYNPEDNFWWGVARDGERLRKPDCHAGLVLSAILSVMDFRVEEQHGETRSVLEAGTFDTNAASNAQNSGHCCRKPEIQKFRQI